MQPAQSTLGATALAARTQAQSQPRTEDLVGAACQHWSEELAGAVEICGLDDLKGLSGCFLEFTTANPGGLVQLLSGRPTKLSTLFREQESYSHAVSRAQAVLAQMGRFAAEHGTAALSLAVGVVSWTESVIPEAPAEGFDRFDRMPGEAGAEALAEDADFVALAHAVAPSGNQPNQPSHAGQHGQNGQNGQAGLPGQLNAAQRNRTFADQEARETARPQRGYAKKTVQMPVLIHPITLKPTAMGDFEAQLDGTPMLNPALARILRRKGALLDPVALVASCNLVSGFRPHEVLDRISSLGEAVIPHFGLLRRTLAGNFVSPRQAIVSDFAELQGDFAKHELVQALAGDQKARAALSAVDIPVLHTEPSPLQERGVGDLDHAQQQVLAALPTGADFFISSPLDAQPGKMAAAIVAEAAAAGRSVLYVSGHRRAGTVLKAALAAADLDELVLEIPPSATWRDDVGNRLLGAMSAGAFREVGATAVHDALIGVRTQLTGYMDGLHRKHSPWGVSAYDALQVLAQLTAGPDGPATTVRLSAQVLNALTASNRAKAAHDLTVAGQLGAFRPEVTNSCWFGATVNSQSELLAALARIRRLVDSNLPLLIAQAEYIADATGLRPASTVAELGDQIKMLAGMRGTLDVFLPIVFERSVRDLISATTPRKQRPESDEFELGILAARRLRKHAKGMVRPGVKVADLSGALEKVEAQREIWAVHAVRPGWPVLPDGLSSIEASYESILGDIMALDPILATTTGIGAGASIADNGGLLALELQDLFERLSVLGSDIDYLDGLPQREDCLRRIRASGLGLLINDFTAREVGPAQVRGELELAWWGSVFEQMIKADPNLAGYDGKSLAALVARFAELDQQHVAALSARVRAKVAAQTQQALAQCGSGAASAFAAVVNSGRATSSGTNQQRLAPSAPIGGGGSFANGTGNTAAGFEALYGALVTGDFQSVRQLVERHGRFVHKLRPVFIATPALVPHLLPTERCVDLVVIEAVESLQLSQLVPTLARATQVVVIGDPHAASGSALPALQEVMVNLCLPMRAAVRDPAITKLMSDHGYGAHLSIAPMPRGSAAVSFEKVEGRGMVDPDSGLVDSTTEELATVVGLVLNHARTRAHESLAIVTLTKRHADAIAAALPGAIKADPTLAAYFGPAAVEPVTVVPASEVAGLRRDAMIFSLGLGCTPHGRVLHNFGQISAPGGAELLNAILAVSRKRLVVVSCFGAGDIDRERIQSGGPEYLVQLLELAQTRSGQAWQIPGRSAADLHLIPGGDDSVVPQECGQPDSPNAEAQFPPQDKLLCDIGDRLKREGYPVEYNYGFAGGPKIPMAVGHRDLPGEMLVAVHSDGPDYLAEPSLRVRDRHRTERLTKMGWLVTQVFSVGAFLDPEGEAARIGRLAQVARASRLTSRADTAPVPSQAEVTVLAAASQLGR
jgi:hypothetical protein